MPLEVERKYLHVDLQALRQTLADSGAHCLGAHFESNWVFDAPDRALLESGRLLRLRSQEWPDRTRHVLTLKRPAPASGYYKVREELETTVEDGPALHAILAGLGYTVTARYEKVREPWRLEDVEVELDALSFIDVVELEGLAAHIDSVQRRLALDKAIISTKSYHELHQEWLRQNHQPPQFSFVFDAAQRAAWRQKLGLPADIPAPDAPGGENTVSEPSHVVE
ncbi:class IV adenylate cyclase [Desulfovibrio legallii]|uniref:class IV adenylate cyclase n=1 Tax=Desulfovibrio legallii TaxID=571438 RepID=UPI000E4CD65A|nr:class IV adenylate cyclase [Desulfovibrio legallii]RHH26136.1 CYTH domain-containing protein [Desulfovibrio sp. AM18-2]